MSALFLSQPRLENHGQLLKLLLLQHPKKWFVNEMYMRVMNNEKVKQEPKKTLQEGRYEPGTIRVKNHQGATRT